MKLVLAASSSALLPLLDPLTQRLDVSVVAVWAPGNDLRREISNRFPAAAVCESWDQLLEIDADAAIVCGADSHTNAAAGQLASVGRSTLVVLDPDVSPAQQCTLCYLWQEGTAPILPALVTGRLAAVEQLRQRWNAVHSVPPRRIDIEQTLPLDLQLRTEITAEEIDRCFFLDAFLIRGLTGEFQEVTALRSGIRGERATLATVSLAAEGSPDVRWTLNRGPNPGCRVVMHGDDDSLESCVDLPNEVPRDAAVQLDAFLKAGAGRPPVMTFNDLIRAGELAAAAVTSYQRRRTIRLHHEEGSERAQFKSQMTAMGCAVLVWALLGSMAMMFAATVLDPRDREYRTASAHGFVVRPAEFEPGGGAQLNAAGREHVAEIARRWSHTEAAVIVEAHASPPNLLDEARRNSVVKLLAAQGVRDPHPRVVARPLSGQTYERLMQLGWLVAFVPLILFLIFQGLIVAARGAQRTTSPAE